MAKVLSVAIRDSNSKSEYDYKTKVKNLADPNLLAQLFEDLINWYNAPVEKAIEIYRKKYRKEKIFPI